MPVNGSRKLVPAGGIARQAPVTGIAQPAAGIAQPATVTAIAQPTSLSGIVRVAGEDGVAGKPTVEDLGIDVVAQDWRRSGVGEGSIEVAFVHGKDSVSAGQHGLGGEWVLMRVAGDPAGRVLVYDRNEWECFLDGVRNGEFEDASE
jgi:hypothetical protein